MLTWVSLLELKKFKADLFIKAIDDLDRLQSQCEQVFLDPNQWIEDARRVVGTLLSDARTAGHRSTEKQAQTILQFSGNIREFSPMLSELRRRIIEDLEDAVFFAVPTEKLQFFEKDPSGHHVVIGPARFMGKEVIDRFPESSEDCSECVKCFVLGRYTASVFHMMRVTELGVLALQVFLPSVDPKAHFGSVVTKLENLVQKNKRADLPVTIQPFFDYIKATLPHLHAVKDSWRNKVDHADGKIIPTEEYGYEMAGEVINATRGLMRKLATVPRSL